MNAPIRRLLPLAAAVMAVVTISCSTPAEGYGPAAEAAFVAGCAPDHREPAQSMCVCAYQRVSSELPFDQYRDIDKQLQKDEGDTPAVLKQAVEECQRAQSSSSSAAGGP